MIVNEVLEVMAQQVHISKIITAVLILIVIIGCASNNNFGQEAESDYITNEIDYSELVLEAYRLYFIEDNKREAEKIVDILMPEFITEDVFAEYNHLLRSIYIIQIPLAEAGINDLNISSVESDIDDLWIGTWNGGVIRYSIPTKEIRILKYPEVTISPNSVKGFSIDDDRVWISLYNGLGFYKKSNSRRYFSLLENGPSGRISSVLDYEESFLASTASDGLWYFDGSYWHEQFSPSKRLNTIYQHDDLLYLGSQDKGLWRRNSDGLWYLLNNRFQGLNARNITTILIDENILWAGCYGEGLYSIDLNNSEVIHYTKENSNLPDNWILDSVEWNNMLFWGTLGGGLYIYDKVKNEWASLSLENGIKSLDIASITYSDNYLVLGTLGEGIILIDEKYFEKRI